jgi:hypothetical protein
VTGPDEVESFSDRFVNVVIDKGILWLLGGILLLVPVIVVAQIGMAQ